MNRGTVDVNSLPKTVTRQRLGCDLNPCPSAPESSTVTSRLLGNSISYRPMYDSFAVVTMSRSATESDATR